MVLGTWPILAAGKLLRGEKYEPKHYSPVVWVDMLPNCGPFQQARMKYIYRFPLYLNSLLCTLLAGYVLFSVIQFGKVETPLILYAMKLYFVSCINYVILCLARLLFSHQYYQFNRHSCLIIIAKFL